jgi:hypothetical protein
MADLDDELKARLERAKARRAKAALSDEERGIREAPRRRRRGRGRTRVAEAKARAVKARAQGRGDEGGAGGTSSTTSISAHYSPTRIRRSSPVKASSSCARRRRHRSTRSRSSTARSRRRSDRSSTSTSTSSARASSYPDVSNHETGMMFRNFLESSIGAGRQSRSGTPSRRSGVREASRPKEAAGDLVRAATGREADDAVHLAASCYLALFGVRDPSPEQIAAADLLVFMGLDLHRIAESLKG